MAKPYPFFYLNPIHFNCCDVIKNNSLKDKSLCQRFRVIGGHCFAHDTDPFGAGHQGNFLISFADPADGKNRDVDRIAYFFQKNQSPGWQAFFAIGRKNMTGD